MSILKSQKISTGTVLRANEALSLGRKQGVEVRLVPGIDRDLADRLSSPFSVEDVQRAAKIAMRRHASR